ncbi:hypothetical protein HPB50_003906 [Hyalomma asiaticum]|uniref:Uncharacterized protein n=1 Tax=Hyalomma asiaticum TaxID=266040 RepID=A0ACB7T5Q0_HYAAI|nr:hypothetical protein HPB50_003906 [Hyalomma asiaticum]
MPTATAAKFHTRLSLRDSTIGNASSSPSKVYSIFFYQERDGECGCPCLVQDTAVTSGSPRACSGDSGRQYVVSDHGGPGIDLAITPSCGCLGKPVVDAKDERHHPRRKKDSWSPRGLEFSSSVLRPAAGAGCVGLCRGHALRYGTLLVGTSDYRRRCREIVRRGKHGAQNGSRTRSERAKPGKRGAATFESRLSKTKLLDRRADHRVPAGQQHAAAYGYVLFPGDSARVKQVMARQSQRLTSPSPRGNVEE